MNDFLHSHEKSFLHGQVAQVAPRRSLTPSLCKALKAPLGLIGLKQRLSNLSLRVPKIVLLILAVPAVLAISVSLLPAFDQSGGQISSANAVVPPISIEEPSRVLRKYWKATGLESQPFGLKILSLNGGRRLGAEDLEGQQGLLTLDAELQQEADSLTRSTKSLLTALIISNPKTGEILAASGLSSEVPNPLLHAALPAASLIKIVTAAAALENSDLSPSSPIKFRGGTYTLNKWNYNPDPRRDSKVMSLREALGKSCNPVFARVAMNTLTPSLLEEYASRFGLGTSLDFDLSMDKSNFLTPGSEYEFSRTAAGFGDVHISPLHANAIMSAIASDGILMRPFVLKSFSNDKGEYKAEPEMLWRVIQSGTAQKLREMLVSTTTEGTSRRAFAGLKGSVLSGMKIAGKTGTLSGQSPKGMTNWFIGAAPAHDPEVVVSAVVVFPNSINTKASDLGRKLLEAYFARTYVSLDDM